MPPQPSPQVRRHLAVGGGAGSTVCQTLPAAAPAFSGTYPGDSQHTNHPRLPQPDRGSTDTVQVMDNMQYGQEGNRAALSPGDRRVDSTLRLWLYPLPPPEPGTLSIVSPGPGPASCPLDGRAIAAAAAKAQPYWH